MRSPLGSDLDELIARASDYDAREPDPDADVRPGRRTLATLSPEELARVLRSIGPMDREAPQHSTECTCEACRLIYRMPDDSGGWSVD
jgi:hypothetical protein